MPDSFKYKLKKASLNKKLVLGGSFLAFISVFMPWYSDVDRFSIGNMFLGITGPLYLMGIIFFAASFASFALVLSQLLEKNFFKLPVKDSHFHIFNSSFNFLMILLSLSIYFHSKFGINLTEKNVGIGLILGFVGTSFLMFGAVLSEKKRAEVSEEEGVIEPLIDLNEQRSKGEIDRNTTVGEAMTQYNEVTKAWGPVQESLNEFLKDNTKDIK